MYTLVAYEESCNIENAIKSVNEIYSDLKYYVSPLHNMDITETGELKKAHWHIILDFKLKDVNHSGKEKEKIADFFGISKGLIQNCRNLQGALRYHIHKDDLNKYQYEADQEYTNDRLTFESAIIQNVKTGASDNLENIFEFIDKHWPEYCDKIEVFRYMRQYKLFLQLASVFSFVEFYLDFYNQRVSEWKQKL